MASVDITGFDFRFATGTFFLDTSTAALATLTFRRTATLGCGLVLAAFTTAPSDLLVFDGILFLSVRRIQSRRGGATYGVAFF